MENQPTGLTEKKFRTKTGFCHVLPDKIVLSRDGIIGGMASVTVGNNIARVLVIRGVIVLALLYAALDSYMHPTLRTAYRPVLFSVFACVLIFSILKSLKNSAAPVIERSSIKEVKFKKAIEGLTRSHFEVFFENGKGSIKKRLILLPGSLMDAQQDETEKALRILREEGILKE